MGITSHTDVFLLAALAAFALAGCGISIELGGDPSERIELHSVPTNGLTGVTVVTDNGAVDVVTGEVDEIGVRAVVVESDRGDADVRVAPDGDRLLVTGDCDSGWWDECHVAFEVEVPPSFDVTVTTDNGRIEVAGSAGHIELESGNGAIAAGALSSERARARTHNGRIELEFDAPPSLVDAETGNGAIVVRVPDDGTVYDIETRTANGHVDVDVDTDRGAARRLTAATANGAIDVDYLHRR